MNISAIISFGNSFDPLSMNIIIEVEKFEHGLNFENTIDEIKDENLKITTSIDINVSAIT